MLGVPVGGEAQAGAGGEAGGVAQEVVGFADVGLGVTFFDDEEKGGVVVSYPVGRTSQTRSIRYVPGDGQGFIEAVESIVTLTEESLDA